MKALAFFVALTLCSIAEAQVKPPAADVVLTEARRQAAKEKKKVFLIFHASWCGWCHKMDSSMNSAALKPLFDKSYVIRHLTVQESPGKKDLENPGAMEMLTQYKGADQGIPFWLVFDAGGNLLADSQMKPGENTGCPAKKEEVDYFLSVLKKTSSLKPAELEKIGSRFRENEVQ